MTKKIMIQIFMWFFFSDFCLRDDLRSQSSIHCHCCCYFSVCCHDLFLVLIFCFFYFYFRRLSSIVYFRFSLMSNLLPTQSKSVAKNTFRRRVDWWRWDVRPCKLQLSEHFFRNPFLLVAVVLLSFLLFYKHMQRLRDGDSNNMYEECIAKQRHVLYICACVQRK